MTRMGLISSILSPKQPETSMAGLRVDLGSFTCGRTALGSRVTPGESYAKYFNSEEVANFPASGAEIGTENGILDYAVFTVPLFRGDWRRNGVRIPISVKAVPDDIHREFGQPYWVDSDDEELLFFYEYQNGEIELQFEFPAKEHLAVITMMRNGILSQPAQRAAYRVTREWPPK